MIPSQEKTMPVIQSYFLTFLPLMHKLYKLIRKIRPKFAHSWLFNLIQIITLIMNCFDYTKNHQFQQKHITQLNHRKF